MLGNADNYLVIICSGFKMCSVSNKYSICGHLLEGLSQTVVLYGTVGFQTAYAGGRLKL